MRWMAGLLLAVALFAPAAAEPVDTGHITAELVAERQGVAPGETIHLAIRQKIQKGWHTYWRNPGDAGEPMRLDWTLPAGWRVGDIVWATPRRLPVGPLMDYGYQGEVLLPAPVTAPADARPGQTVALKAAAAFLVCAETCVPEEAVLQLSLPVTAAPAPPDPKWGPSIRRALAKAPGRTGLSAVFESRGDRLALAVTGPALRGADLGETYFYPYSDAVIDHASPQRVERGPEGLTVSLSPGAGFQDGRAPARLEGVLTVGEQAFEISAQGGAPPPGAGGLGPPPARLPAGEGGLSLLPAVLFALLGGLVLNLMPCVFPVLAMKAASLAGHAGQEIATRRQGLAFAAGVLTTFLVLAGVLIALKAAGAAVGWGFQLQSPVVVGGLALLMLGVALNLSGLFEVAGALQGVGSGLAGRKGLTGAFFTGALSVVVAAPCTAPFMGAALGWALTHSAAAALVVFLALGVGFAAPFVLLAYAPGLIARLPPPGPWMDVFRKALAFPMYAAAAWLVWVLTLQAGPDGLAAILAAGVALALAAWLVGAAQRRAASGGRAAGLAAIAGVLALATVGGLGAALWPRDAETGPGGAALAASDKTGEAYTPERLAALLAEGRPVFVNYTAAWCVSCQVNDRVALSTLRAAEAFRRNGVAYLKADWTRRDPMIAADLARFGRAGVPLYVLYSPGGGAPKVLPAILTEGMVVKALDAARDTRMAAARQPG